MAQDHLILHINDRVVPSTSLGNQEKWFDAEKNLWYKVDNGHFEALAEAMASEVLRRFTNAADLPGISTAHALFLLSLLQMLCTSLPLLSYLL